MDDANPKQARRLSLKSVKSAKSVIGFDSPGNVQKPIDLEEHITVACQKFVCPCKIVVKKDVIVDEYIKLMKLESAVKYKRISLAPPLARLAPSATPDSEKETEETASKATSVDENAITITALYDSLNRLSELLLQKICVPRILIQILGIIIPHYVQLTKMAVKKCRIDAYTIHEINKFLPLSMITEINFDESPLPEANYAILLETQSKLTSLSLCRCKINDEVCKQIAATLHFLEPAESTLITLNLSSNHITDEGAKYLGEALRTNRHLRYLNLADNRLGDDGANHIFNALIDFPLTYDETLLKRRRYMTYLRDKRALYLKLLTTSGTRSIDDISMMSKKSGRKSITTPVKPKPKKDKIKSGTYDDYSQTRAETLASEIMGPFTDPFVFYNKVVDGFPRCIGNMVLCYLNLCYNDLSYLSLKKLQTVLFYQSVNKKPNQTGLLRVLVEGNQLPLAPGSSELERISEMLNRNVINFSAKYITNKQKARARISVVPERK